MIQLTPIFKSLRILIASLLPRRRIQLGLLMGLMLLAALAEVMSLSAIVPFLAVLANPLQALQSTFVMHIVDTLGLSNAEDIRWQLTLMFVSTAVGAGVVRFVLTFAIAKLNYGIGHELGSEVYLRSLYQPYEVHIARNSSEIIGGINKVDIVVLMFFYLLNAFSAFLMAFFIITVLVLIDPFISTAALLGIGCIYVAVSMFTRKRLARNSGVINSGLNTRVQTVQEGLNSIRDVLLDHAQPEFARFFNQIDRPFRQAQASNNIIGPGPRFFLEAVAMVLIATLGYYMTLSGGGVLAAIPTLGALALGAQRLMPLLQQIYQGWVYVTGNRQVLSDVVALLQQPIAREAVAQVAPLAFEREIRLENVSFRYQPHMPLVLNQLDLVIPKGLRVGIIGATGSGKSTAMDLLMGLLQPSAGQIFVDGFLLTDAARLAWHRNIAHVPQAIFLADASFAENIAFGIPTKQIDLARVRKAAQQAQISEFIESKLEGYAAMVGERGVRLSGGQRQRIGIARALYKRANFLVFDEATSALDSETEVAVMQAIENLGRDLTIVLIAHRLTTLKGCEIIYRLDKGCVVSKGGYSEIMTSPKTTVCKIDTFYNN